VIGASRDPSGAKLFRRLVSIAGVGLVTAALVGAGGRVVERTRLGTDNLATLVRIEDELQGRFDRSASTLASLAAEVAASSSLIMAASDDPAEASLVFTLLDELLPIDGTGDTGITVYGPGARPIAWAGRVSDLPLARLDGAAALFVAPGALGPRLVRIEPIGEPGRTGAGAATIAVEQLLGEVRVEPGLPDTFLLSTSIVPVTVRARVGEPITTSPYSFVIPSLEGPVLVEAQVAPDELTGARDGLRRETRAVVLSVLGITLLLCAAPFVDARRRSRTTGHFLLATAGLLPTIAGARWIFQAAITRMDGPLAPSAHLFLTALWSAVLVWIGIDLVERWRGRSPRPPVLGDLTTAGNPVRLGLSHAAAGCGAAWILWAYLVFLRSRGAELTVDLLHFSLHPLDVSRFLTSFSLLVMHATAIWAGATLVELAKRAGRPTRQWPAPGLVAVSWLLGALLGVRFAAAFAPSVATGPLAVSVLAAGLCAAAVARLRPRVRHASRPARLGVAYIALLIPAVAMYPSLNGFASESRERLVADEYGPQAATLRDDLQESLGRALEAIDAIPKLSGFLPQVAQGGAPTTEHAFQVWSQTDLANSRLTSAVELYERGGRLLSRFALNLPDYAVPSAETVRCDWEILDEAFSFGSSERHVLRASRGICEDGPRLGTIVVRAMLDYRTLPFVLSQSPYLESLRPESATGSVAHAPELEFVVYGWSRAPMYVSGTSVFPLSQSVFQRMVVSRDPFWSTIARDDGVFRVYFMSDRGGIYAVGYAVTTIFDHLVGLAELVVLVGVLYVMLLAGAMTFSAFGAGAPSSGRALLRELRSSFYRKLSLAFVGVSVVPVVALALATRAYFANELQAGVEESAVQTATVAQRLVEDYATLQQSGPGTLDLIDDQIMVLVSRAIDQSVNLFDGAELQATSVRDLFASRLLPARTPADVYRSIVLERLPTFVGEEEVGGLRYLVAAAPVRSGGTQRIVTVPQTLRLQENERQRDELDRRVLSASVLFVLVGLALGYSMAERIADPVNRLTRATRRIARGDLDARIAATSSDELRRLVEDFNRMAADLKRQRGELERTQRLEAWAEMARHVAHDIKNPLTPIQLSAEHARRVNLDRGSPLSPVLDECVHAILTQVKLLRQISAEFSSFASSPTARLERTDPTALVEEVIAPYRAGLINRIAINVVSQPNVPAVLTDRTLFARALTNIIENALHAMPSKGTLTIATQVEDAEPAGGTPRGPRAVTIKVTDNGVGMDPDALAKIFEPYFSTKATGTGLGLTIAKRNIELIGGSIAIQSERNVGSTFTLRVPVADSGADAPPPNRDRVPPDAPHV